MREMEEEVTKVQLGRYKSELEEKQKMLKWSKKYEGEVRDIRKCMGYIMGKIGMEKEAEEYF